MLKLEKHQFLGRIREAIIGYCNIVIKAQIRAKGETDTGGSHLGVRIRKTMSTLCLTLCNVRKHSSLSCLELMHEGHMHCTYPTSSSTMPYN